MNATKRGRRPPLPPSVRTWRATTAVRVFALALVLGQVLSAGSWAHSAALLFVLAVVALASSTVEAGWAGRRSPWVPVVEGILAATLLTTSLPVDSLLPYLAVPPVVAGLRHGWVTTVNTTLSSSVAVVASSIGYRDLGLEADRLADSFPWLAIGCGAGLLAAWQSREVRRLEATRAPYSVARHHLSQLHALADQGHVGLDSSAVASQLAEAIRSASGATASAVYLVQAGTLDLYARVGDVIGLDDVASTCQAAGHAVTIDGRAAWVLRLHDEVFGVVAVRRERPWSSSDLHSHQALVDDQAPPLETAALFDSVRLTATSEERNRLAREMHDGVAQEMVALGYLVDEIESQASDSAALEAAASLRAEIARVVGELRFSIYDLRHELADQDLAGALTDYAMQVSAGTELRVHLSFDEQGPRLAQRVQAEVLRIAQEAITNVRKHAHAINLWVSFTSDGDAMHLVIEDDGIGSAGPKARHFGMHTMSERAVRMGAELTVAERRDGGTVVSLRSKAYTRIGDDRRHEHSSPAGR